MIGSLSLRQPRRQKLAARLVLTFVALLPYWPLLTLSTIYVTDDFFTSDIFNGELAGRALIGSLVRNGQLPLWTSSLCSGIPLTGFFGEPIGLVLFSFLPPAAALDLFVIILLLIAAHGAYGLARRLGAEQMGAILAGFAFANSGYMACQLKHLAAVFTVAWLPLGLTLLDRAIRAEGATLRKRAHDCALFGLVLAEQLLAGFPQSAYICCLAYLGYSLFLIRSHYWQRGYRRQAMALISLLGLATMLATAAAAVVLLPLGELAASSDRAQSQGWDWATMLPYWPRNLLTFILPYVNGDISDNSYGGPSLFWEDYGYVGVATFALSIYASIAERKKPVIACIAGLTVVAYLLVLGPTSVIYQFAYYLVPGMNMFRFPTRFMAVVDLGLAVLAGVGLTRLGKETARRWPAKRGLSLMTSTAICVFTLVDLVVHQPRQNPMVEADEWLAPPASVAMVSLGATAPRTYTPQHGPLHHLAFREARGWSDLEPYFAMRELLQPNLGAGYWGIPSADCYTGIAPSWYVDTWGDHSRPGLLLKTLTKLEPENRLLLVHSSLPTVLKTYGVTHVLSPYRLVGADLPMASADAPFIYAIDGAARLRIVPHARRVASNEEAASRMRGPAFDPTLEVLLHDAPPTLPDALTTPAADLRRNALARITGETASRLTIEVQTDHDGFLVLADTFYPGWIATVDGSPVPLYRANISLRTILVAKGQHQVEFTFEVTTFRWGLMISVMGLTLLGGALAATAKSERQLVASTTETPSSVLKATEHR